MKLKALASAAALVIALWYSGAHAPKAQVKAPDNSGRAPQTVAEFDAMFKQVSNWGRWGKEDELGTLNLITNAKRKQAADLVKTGEAYSLAHRLITDKAEDMPNPFEMTNAGRTFTISFHSTTHSHVDALCQFDYQGKIYNGFDYGPPAPQTGCAKADMEDIKLGFTTRAVLFDIPRLKGVPYLEPGTPIYPEDLEAWEKKIGTKIGPGDALLLRTGRWERRAKVGPWNLIPANPIAGEAGYHVSTIPWLRQRDVAVIAADVSNDVRPSGVPKEVLDRVRSMPVHSLAIVAMGAYIIDAVDLEAAARAAARLNRWEFMVTGSGMNAAGGTGSPLNLTAVF